MAGATRGAGRGTAIALGEAGATVYGTGRSTDVARRNQVEAAATCAAASVLTSAAP